MEWYLDVLRNRYADFDGRARRKEYWMFTLFNILASIGIVIASMILGFISEMFAVLGVGAYVIYSFGVIVPGLAVSVRRLHDTGRSGWFLLVALIPFIGGLIVLLFLISEGDRGPNEYGSDPKDPDDIGLSTPPISTERSFSVSVGASERNDPFGNDPFGSDPFNP